MGSWLALLAPVPLVHLESAVNELPGGGRLRVAFGSNSWEALESPEIEEGDDVYIYASHADGTHDREATWQAEFERYVRREEYQRDKVNEVRPPSCLRQREEAFDAPDPWAGHYIVRGLRRLDPPMAIRDFAKRDVGPELVPHGPFLVRSP